MLQSCIVMPRSHLLVSQSSLLISRPPVHLPVVATATVSICINAARIQSALNEVKSTSKSCNQLESVRSSLSVPEVLTPRSYCYFFIWMKDTLSMTLQERHQVLEYARSWFRKIRWAKATLQGISMASSLASNCCKDRVPICLQGSIPSQ